MKLKRPFSRAYGWHLPTTKRKLSVQVRILVYVSVVVFVLAGLEMILLPLSNSSNSSSSSNHSIQPAAIATLAPTALNSANDSLPNSKEEAAKFNQAHQSRFNFNDSVSTFENAGYQFKSNLNLAPAGSNIGASSFDSRAGYFQQAVKDQQQKLKLLAASTISTTATADNYEPDDSPQQAQTLAVTVAPDLSGSQTHSFTTVGDVDWVYFQIRKPGVNYTIFTNATNASGVDTKLDLYDSNLNLVASNDDASVLIGDNPHNSAINFVPPDTGSVQTYFLRITDVAVNGAAGNYFLTAYQASSLPGQTVPATYTASTPLTAFVNCNDAYYPDNKPSQATLLNPSLTSLSAFGTTGYPPVDTTNDGTQQHSICPAGQVDWVYFDLIAGKPYTVFTSALKGGLDTFILLYSVASNDNLVPLYSNDDFPGMGLASRIDYIVPVTSSTPLGTPVRFYLAIKDVANHGGSGMDYNITLATVGDSLGDCNDLYQPDYNPVQAKDIQINETQTHNFCPAGQSHWVRFFAKAGRTYTMQTIFVSGTPGLDTSINLYSVQFDPKNPASVVSTTPLSGQQTAANSNPNDLESTVSFSVPSDGYYYAQIQNAGGFGAPGLTYQLRFAVAAGSGNSFSATQTASIQQTAGAQTGSGTQTALAQANNQTATAVALTVFAVNGTQTAALQTATAQGTPNPTQQTITAAAIRTATATASGFIATPAPAALSNAYFADLSFSNIWSQVDKPVVDGQANRSWEYGPKPGPMKIEQYAEALGGSRQVQYFSKSRMEINNPKADRNTAWFVTNGLLVKEMISGAIAVGDNKYQPKAAPLIPVAGDLTSNNDAPTYASFGKIITINNSNRATDQTGQVVNQSVNRNGVISTLASPPQAVKYASYIPETGHNIADKFWDYLNSQGVLYQDNQYQTGPLMNWVFVMGLPLSEPYWTKAMVGGVERDVLVQVFERRILTYTPSNPAGWQVEMGNVGEHYYLWRYGVSMYADN